MDLFSEVGEEIKITVPFLFDFALIMKFSMEDLLFKFSRLKYKLIRKFQTKIFVLLKLGDKGCYIKFLDLFVKKSEPTNTFYIFSSFEVY